MSGGEVSTYSVGSSAVCPRGKRRILTVKQKNFLQILAGSGDDVSAAKESGYRNVFEAMESDLVRSEAEKIQQAWSFEVRMNAKFASGEHMRLQEKFEDEYDKSDRDDRIKMASVLAKMSDTSLKASGKMNNSLGDSGNNIMVQLNIGGSSLSDAKPIDGVQIVIDKNGEGCEK